MAEPTDALPSFPAEAAEADPASYEPSYGDVVDREGVYVVAPLSGSKRLQSVSLRFDDGEVWVRAYRPIAEELQYADKRVRVRGRPYVNSPLVQSVDATHFELQSIELAPGETAYDPPPTQIPAPPQVEDGAALRARVGLWAHCVGTLEALQAPGEDDAPWWGRGRLRLSDGSEVALRFISWSEGPPALQTGALVTALGPVQLEDGQLALGGPLRLCAGRVARCQMDAEGL